MVKGMEFHQLHNVEAEERMSLQTHRKGWIVRSPGACIIFLTFASPLILAWYMYIQNSIVTSGQCTVYFLAKNGFCIEAFWVADHSSLFDYALH